MTTNAASTLIAGKYEVLQALDTCATGGALRVRHAAEGGEFALTVVTLDGPAASGVADAVRRATRLGHEHIVPLAEAFDAPGGLHVVEALVDAEPLATRLAAGPLSPLEALRLARQVADALAHAHDAGIVHGALGTATVSVERTSGRALVGGFAPALLPVPEADPRTDVCALGALLFEMLEGKPLVVEATASDGPSVPRFSRIAPTGVPALVGRAVRRRPADRFQSMAGMRAAIDACLQRLGQSVVTAPPATPLPAGRPVRRVVPDQALLEDLGEDECGGDSETPAVGVVMPGVRMKDLLLAKAARAAARPAAPAEALPPPVVVAEGGRRRGTGRVMAVAGAIVGAVAVLTLVLGWPRGAQVAPPPIVVADAPVEPVAVVAAVAETPPLVVEAPAVDTVALRHPDPSVVEARHGFEVAADEPAPKAVERNVAPRVVRQQPAAREAVRVTEGQSVELAVRATDRNAGDDLRYGWFVDGAPVKGARGAAWRFTGATGRAGTAYTVAVEVTDRAGLRAPRATWRVEVTARMSEANVHDWLTRLALAYERKDIATLRLFGLVTSDTEASAIRKRVPWLGGYHVSAMNPTVHLDRQYASVAFDRIETDGGGKVIRSAREAYQLEKQPNGFVGLRR